MAVFVLWPQLARTSARFRQPHTSRAALVATWSCRRNTWGKMQRDFASHPEQRMSFLQPVPASASILGPYNIHHLIRTLQLGQFTEDDVSAAFDRIDVNRDGVISASELSTIFRPWTDKHCIDEELADRMAQEFLRKWNKDKSGVISKEEFKHLAQDLGNSVHPTTYQLAGCIFLLCLPYGLLVPFEPQLVQCLDITAAQFGIAQGAMFVAKFFVNIPITGVVDKIGSKPVLLASTVCLGTSVGMMSMVTTLPHLIACRAVGGIAVAGLMAAIQGASVTIQTPLNRARSLAPFTQAMNAGVALGPGIGGLLAGVCSMQTAFAGVGCTIIASAAVMARVYSEVKPGSLDMTVHPIQLLTQAFSSWYKVCKTVDNVPLLTASQAALWFAVGGTSMTCMPLLLFAEPLSFSPSAIGALAAGVACLGVVTTQPLARFADAYGRRTALGVGSAIMGVSVASVPLMGTPAMVSGAIAGAALGQNLLAPAIQALAIDAVVKKDPALLTQTLSLLRSAQDVGMVLGATVIGAIGTEYGYLCAYEASSSALLLMGLMAYVRSPKVA